ncbi:ATP-binding cassette domain-containing protein [Natrialbaceae archaeon A-gly3]
MASHNPFDRDGPLSGEREQRTEDEESHDSGLPIGLTLLAGAVAAVVVVPVVWIFVTALSVDLERAVEIVVRMRTLEVLANTVALIVIVTTLSVLIGVPLAFLTTMTDLPFRRGWIVALALPLVIPSYTSAYAFISVWGPHGLVQSLVAPLGIESLPEIYGMPGTVFILTLYNYPFVFITTVAGLRAFDKTYVDAARTLEDDLWGVFRRVVLPMAKPAILAGALLAALETAGDFGVPAMLRFDVLTRQIYVEYNALAFDYAAMLSVHLIAITLVILAIEAQIRDHASIHGGSRGESRGYTIELGRWKWPALAVCGTIVLFAIILPIVFLTWWLIRGPETYVGSLEFQWEYAVNSTYVSVLAAVVAAALAVPVAYLAARYRSPLSAALERATYVGFAVPGVVIGLSLVFFGSSYLPAVYQTIPLLVFAYVVLYLPLAVGSVRTSVLYVNPHYLEAARTLGCSPLAAFRKITLPLMIPGIVAGGALVFLHGMKELPATLLLRPIGFESLATFIWMVERNAYYGYAAVPALVLVAVSGLAILAVLPGERIEGWSILRRFRRRTDPAPDAADGLPDLERTPTAADGGSRERGDDREVILELEGVDKSYGGRVAASDLSFSVREGELLTLLGPSGCGKTTTLRLIAGLDRPDAGTVRIHDEVVADGDTYVPSEGRDVGIVFQDFALFPHKTVGENVAFGLEGDANEAVVEDALELVGLAAYRNSYPDELSGGQKQRIALARSLAPEPEILLLDEPLSNLDAGLRVRMRETISDILEAVDVTAVWVTHDQEEALSVGDRTAVMNAGGLEQVDPPRELFLEPASRMVADFLGRASYLTGHAENGVVETPIGTLERDAITSPGRLEATPLDVLVRPDDVAIEPVAEADADGRVVHRGFNGPTVRYRVELGNGDLVRSLQSHEQWLEVGDPVSVSIIASHDLPAFESDLG